MPSTPAVIATGVALAGLGGLAGANLAVDSGTSSAAATQSSKAPVEVRTQLIRRVEHRVRHERRHDRSAPAP
ncbi:MAG: hypothetical protein ACJ76V_15865, partial [Thermoleophilaceae bacterium]